MPLDLERLTEEYGLIENISAFGFALAAIFTLILFVRGKEKLWACFSYLMTMAFMREMDLHKAWTTDSILKSRFYLDPQTPFWEKIFGGVIILSLILCAVYLLGHVKLFLSRLIRWDHFSLLIAAGIGTIVASKTLDSFIRLFPLWQDFHHDHDLILRVAEESFDVVAAIFFLAAAAIPLFRKK